jgi:hypothetical protein
MPVLKYQDPNTGQWFAVAQGIPGPQGPPGDVSGVPNHGTLPGLNQDDHLQYHNDFRGDQRYSQLAHNHDQRYSQLTHGHTAADIGAEPVDAVANHVALPDPHTQYATKPYVDGTPDIAIGTVWSTFAGSKPITAYRVGRLVSVTGSMYNSGLSISVNSEHHVATISVGFRPTANVIFPVIWVEASPYTQWVSYGFINTFGHIRCSSSRAFNMLSADSVSFNFSFAL